MGAAEVASLYGTLGLKDEFTPGLKNAQRAAGAFERGMGGVSRSVSGFGDKLTSAGRSLAPFSAAFGAIGYKSLDVAADFESAMAEISVRTGLVGEDLKVISDLALQMGADTMFSSQQAADAFLQLLSSGQSTTEAIATLEHVLNLAAASGEDLGYTADALTDIMAAFNLEVEDAAHVTDVLSAAAGASSADIASLADGFANVGPIARQFGLDVDTTAATLAVLAENGIKGAEAGTALKSMLMNMTRDTEEVNKAWSDLGTSFYDAEGNARPLVDVLADIKEGLADKSAEEQNRIIQDLAGSYGAVALTALLGDLSIRDMSNSMNDQATAAELADSKMGTFESSVDGLTGSIETLQTQAFTPFMKDTLQPLIDDHLIPAINAVSEWAVKNPELTSTIIALGGGVMVLSAALLILGPLMGALVASFTTLLLPLAVVGGLLYLYTTNTWGFKDAIDSVKPGLMEYVEIWKNFKIIMENLPQAIDLLVEKLSTISVPDALREIVGAVGTIFGVGMTAEGVGAPAAPPPSSFGSTHSGFNPGGHDFVGPYNAGQPYVIGRAAQPELFVPGESGTAYPAGSYGGSSPVYLTVQLDSATLFDGVVAEGDRRNVVVVAGVG